jgi:hypothetical protein
MDYRVAVLGTILTAAIGCTISAKAEALPSQSGAAAAKSQNPPTAVTTGQTTAGLAPTARCDAFAPVFQSNYAWTHQPCSAAICNDPEYNSTSFSLEQIAICKKAGMLRQPQKPRWKTYEAANGEKFEVNMNAIRHMQLGVMVWGGIHGVDVVAQPFIFDCHGHVIMPAGGNGANGPVSTGWILVPPRSVLGQVARDVCRNQSSLGGRPCVNEMSGQRVTKACGVPGEPPYCIGYSPAACKRIRQAVNSKVRPYYCKKQWQYTGSGLTEEQVRICSVRVSEGIDPMPQ